MSILAWLGLGTLGAFVLGAWAWAASKSAARADAATYIAPRADLRSLKELQARARRFDSGMDRTRGEKRGENNDSRINVIRERP